MSKLTFIYAFLISLAAFTLVAALFGIDIFSGTREQIGYDLLSIAAAIGVALFMAVEESHWARLPECQSTPDEES